VIKPNLSFYSPYYAEACNEFAVPIFASLRQGNTATSVDVEAVANHLQCCVRTIWLRLYSFKYGGIDACDYDNRTISKASLG